jgi:Fur family transcriptional regulator, ferric uptake regulator
MKRRNTAAKQAVLDLLHSSKVALSQEDIEREVKASMNRVTVYRVLNSFCEDGYVHKILSDDGRYYFALCVNCKEKQHRHDHFHFRCLSCQQMECLKEEVKFKVPKGYRLESVNCLVTGYCRKCSK